MGEESKIYDVFPYSCELRRANLERVDHIRSY